MSDTVTALMDAAEARIRGGGFHAMSFRDLADDLGIKSASVHYHFRRKSDLGIAVVQRYADAFFEKLAEVPANAGPRARLERIADTYRAALNDANKACLCGVLGAEVFGLPEDVAAEVRKFLQRNVDWVAKDAPDARARAETVIAALQGAMLLAVNLGDPKLLDRVAAQMIGAFGDV